MPDKSQKLQVSEHTQSAAFTVVQDPNQIAQSKLSVKA